MAPPADRPGLGELGEAVVARSYRRAGFRVRGRRLFVQGVELDLVVTARRQVIVVEVKAGRSTPGHAEAAFDLRWRPGGRFDARALEDRWRAARHLGRALNSTARVDLVEVLVSRGQPAELRFHEGLREPLPSERSPLSP